MGSSGLSRVVLKRSSRDRDLAANLRSFGPLALIFQLPTHSSAYLSIARPPPPPPTLIPQTLSLQQLPPSVGRPSCTHLAHGGPRTDQGFVCGIRKLLEILNSKIDALTYRRVLPIRDYDMPPSPAGRYLRLFARSQPAQPGGMEGRR